MISKKTKTNKIWGERMRSKPSYLLTKINASINIDTVSYTHLTLPTSG